jgi:hypothetical protein
MESNLETQTDIQPTTASTGSLSKWVRIDRNLLVAKEDVVPAAEGRPGLLVASYDGTGDLKSDFYGLDDLQESAKNGFLSTSDDPLYLISPYDVVEVNMPRGDGKFERAYLNAEPDSTGYDGFHESALEYFSALESHDYPAGSYVSAICVPPPGDMGGRPTPLIKRDGPDGHWTLASTPSGTGQSPSFGDDRLPPNVRTGSPRR